MRLYLRDRRCLPCGIPVIPRLHGIEGVDHNSWTYRPKRCLAAAAAVCPCYHCHACVSTHTRRHPAHPYYVTGAGSQGRPESNRLAIWVHRLKRDLYPHTVQGPALHELYLRSLKNLGYHQRPIGPSLARFIGLSAPPLRLLELHDIDLDSETFEACFAALLVLRELHLYDSSISDAAVLACAGSVRVSHASACARAATCTGARSMTSSGAGTSWTTSGGPSPTRLRRLE
ncbi:hypothetical protein GY45DRAFT_413919 [Cubamyces sp. BRFM 1775]|nr:hypothetical protein GY45DRAFT_413919 [Cubamyces sp. BRFM 1775]